MRFPAFPLFKRARRGGPMAKILGVLLFRPVIPLLSDNESKNLNDLILIPFGSVRARARMLHP
jgi:hypothetical protein